ncbi:MAG: ATP12 family chaperone protein [Paracoccaceae bacterium]
MKRFWKQAIVEEGGDGWSVLLDGRPVRTPARNAVTVPVQTIAEEIATEWDAQGEDVDPRSMPMTRMAATCLDRVAPEMAAVAEMIAAYGETDLLCYRADAPAELVERQVTGWNPVLDWASDCYGARLNTGAGVMHIPQPPSAVSALRNAVLTERAWSLTALSELTTISGSLVLGLAVRHGWLGAEKGWSLSRIDEDWNIELWGDDQELAQLTAKRQADFMLAARTVMLLEQCQGDGRNA